MPQPEAKKPAEEHGIKKQDIKNFELVMRGRMMELADEITKEVKSGWDKRPKEFFKSLGERLKKNGIDELEFAHFISGATDNSIALSIKQDLALAEAARGGKDIRKKPGVIRLSSSAEKQIKVNKELMVISTRMFEAIVHKEGCAEFFGKMDENKLRAKIEEDRKFADFLIGITMDLETKGKSHWRVTWKPER